jgi:hypothetical protein
VKRAALFCAALALLGATYAFRAAEKMPDFEVYWRAADRASRAEPLYRAEDGHYQLKYLPAFAVLAAPLAWLPLVAAKPFWFAASSAALGAFVAMSIALLPERRRPTWLLTLCVIVAMAKFYGHELVLGQVNLLFGALVTAAVHLLRGARPLAAGVLLAVAVTVKPYAVVFVPWVVAVGEVRAAIAAAAALAAAVAVPVAVYGASQTMTLHVEWWKTVSESTAPNLLNADNVSVAAMFAKWLEPGPAATALALALSLVLLLAAVDIAKRRAAVREPLALEAALLLTLIPLLSPQGWDYVFLLATPAIALLVNYADRLPGWLTAAAAAAVGTVAFSLFDIMGRRAYARFMELSIVTVCFLTVVGALYALRFRRVS